MHTFPQWLVMNVLNVFFFFFFQNVTFLKRSIDIIIFKLNSNEFKSLAQEMINIKKISSKMNCWLFKINFPLSKGKGWWFYIIVCENIQISSHWPLKKTPKQLGIFFSTPSYTQPLAVAISISYTVWRYTIKSVAVKNSV